MESDLNSCKTVNDGTRTQILESLRLAF